MKIKYLVPAMLLGVCTLAGVGVSAKTAVWGSVEEDGTARLAVSSDHGQAVYAAYVLKPGAEPQSLAEATQSGDFVGLETVSASDTDGFSVWNLDFALPDAGPGSYTAVLGGGELAGHTLKLVYPEAAEAQAAAAAVKAASASALESVLTQYQDKAWCLDLSNSAYTGNSSGVRESMAKILAGGGTSPGEVTRAFDQACALVLLKTCPQSEAGDNLLMYEPLMQGSYGQAVREDTQAMAETFVNLRRDEALETPADLSRLVTASQGVVLLNRAGRDEVLEILKQYNDIFGLDFSGDYAKADPYEVAKRVIAGNSPYTTLSQVRSRFATAVKEALEKQTEDKQDDPPKSPGGGSGGGGRGPMGGTVGGPAPSPDAALTPDKVSQVESEGIFTDLEEASWAVPYIKYLAENNIMQGDGDGRFRPGDSIRREEFLKLALSALDLAGETDAPASAFRDVEEGAWYQPYVEAGVSLGIITGVSPEEFGVGQEISRQDAAVMISRALTAAQAELYATGEPLTFQDGQEIADYAEEAVNRLVMAGVINGYEDGNFLPHNPILRAEAAKMMYTAIRGIIQ